LCLHICLIHILPSPYAFSNQFNKLVLIGDPLVYALSLIDIFSLFLWLKILELPLIGIILPPLLWNELLLQVLVRPFDLDLAVGCSFNVDVIDPNGVLMLIFNLLLVMWGGVSRLLIMKLIHYNKKVSLYTKWFH